MKIFLKLLLSLLLFAFTNVKSFVQTEAEAAMQSGNSFYQKENYKAAAQEYESVLQLGYESAPLFYNLGNTYFRLNELGKAILNYEKSLKLEPGDEDAIYNLRIAEARTVDKIQTVPKIFISEWWEILVTSFSVSGWGIVFVIFYIIMLGLIAFYFLTRSGRMQRFAFYLGVVNLSVVFLVLILFVLSYNREVNSNYGVLIEDMITAKQSPNQQSSDAFVIHEGVKFEIQETLNNWAKIKLEDGKVGWLPENSFGKI